MLFISHDAVSQLHEQDEFVAPSRCRTQAVRDVMLRMLARAVDRIMAYGFAGL